MLLNVNKILCISCRRLQCIILWSDYYRMKYNKQSYIYIPIQKYTPFKKSEAQLPIRIRQNSSIFRDLYKTAWAFAVSSEVRCVLSRPNVPHPQQTRPGLCVTQHAGILFHIKPTETFISPYLITFIILFNFALSVGKMKLECISLSLTRKMIDGTERYRLRVDPSGCSISGHSFVCNRQLSQTCTKFFFFFKHH